MHSVFLAFEEEELVLLRDAVDLLSPDEDEVADLAADLSHRLSSRIENVDLREFELTSEELEIMISSLEIVSPDELVVVQTAQELEDRLRDSHRLLEDDPDPEL